jgi:16S rRNA (uracil1498-N3)-methyltransferase
MRKKMNEKPPAEETRPPRVLVPDLAAHGDGEEVLLRKEESTHLRARRLVDGDQVLLFDGKGARGRGTVSLKGTGVRLSAFEENPGLLSPFSSAFFASLPGEPGLRVTVLVACAEPARVEWAVEKGTECGAAAFVLLEAARSQRAHVAALRTRLVRLSRIAAEAAKQCDRTIVPEVEGPETTGDFLRRWKGRVLLAHPGGQTLVRTAIDHSGRVALAIGPEGGFDPSEVLLFEEFGSLFFALGPRILRLETAVVVALARLVDRG